MRKLILFDIDQTLVNIIDFHSKAYAAMFNEIFEIDGVLEDIKYDGLRFPDVVKQVALVHDVGEMNIEAKQDDALNSYLKHFTANLPEDTSEYVLPGVFTLLEKINNSEHIAGIVTGNSKLTGERILKSAKLYDYFKIFAYCDDAKTREKIVEKAILRADEEYLIHFKEDALVIIGDTIHDIDSGKPYNARTIAVLTGSYSKEELKEHNPDYIFKDMRNAEMIYKAIID